MHKEATIRKRYTQTACTEESTVNLSERSIFDTRCGEGGTLLRMAHNLIIPMIWYSVRKIRERG